MKKFVLLVASLLLLHFTWSKNLDVIELQFCYAKYDGASSKIEGRISAFLPNDSVVSMVYQEYSFENENTEEGLYVAGRDSLYFFSDGDKKSWFFGDLKRIQLTNNYLVVQQIEGVHYTFSLLDLSTQLWSGDMSFNTTHFHQFVSIENKLYLSYVKNDGGDDYMVIKKYSMPSLQEDLTFNYINLSWQHITMSFGENEIYVFESFSKKLTKLDNNGATLKDTIFPDAYEFVFQEIGFKSELHYLKNYAGDLFSFTEKDNVFSMQNLGNNGDFYLLDYNSGLQHLMTLKKSEVDQLSSDFYMLTRIEEKSIIAFCSFIFLPTGIEKEELSMNKTKECYTINSFVQEDFHIVSLIGINGQLNNTNIEAKNIKNLNLQKGLYILKIKNIDSTISTARLLVE